MLYILISVWMTMTFIQGHSCRRNQKLWCPFYHKFGIDLDKILCVATTCLFVKAHAEAFFALVTFKEENLRSQGYGKARTCAAILL